VRKRIENSPYGDLFKQLPENWILYRAYWEVAKYRRTGNRDKLIDAACFCCLVVMMERECTVDEAIQYLMQPAEIWQIHHPVLRLRHIFQWCVKEASK